jgi:hypothetical protein
MKRASLIAAVLLLQLTYLPLVAQASLEEKAVGKAALFYRHLNIARGIYAPSPSPTASTPKQSADRLEVVPPPQARPEPVKINPAQSALAQ